MDRLHQWQRCLRCNILLIPGCTGVPQKATGKHRYIARILPVAQPRPTQLIHRKICLDEVPTEGNLPKLSGIISRQYHHSFNIMCATTRLTLPFFNLSRCRYLSPHFHFYLDYAYIIRTWTRITQVQWLLGQTGLVTAYT